MNANEIIKMLTGARAVIIDAETDRFFHFTTLTENEAISMMIRGNSKFGITASGELWCLISGCRYRYVFADKSLAAIAE